LGADGSGAENTQRSVGWYAGALLFWLIAAWLAAAGLSSLVPQIFGPSFQAARSGESCGEDLHDLTDELLDRTGDWLKGHPERNTRDKLQAYFADFDRRLMQTKLSCNESERAAFTELSRLRHGVSALLERFDREELPHVRKLNELLHPQGVPSP
jgi:hypothetical protein